MLAFLSWNLDPVLFWRVRYYGVVFATTIVVAFFLWQWQMRRGGYDKAIIDRFLVWGVVATIVGARLGHCLFYEPGVYLSNPVLILHVWEGGLASHGATIGLLLALFLFARRHRLSPLELMDRFTFSASIGAFGVRLANFLNSEIVGRVTDVPWAIRFMRNTEDVARWQMDRIPIPARHPSQLYEMSLALATLLILLLADRLAGRERRPLGLLTGLFLAIYFGVRFFLEFLKEYQTTWEQNLTAGQFLSILPAAAGVALIWWALKKRQPTNPKAK
ncbi:MAG: prolipoprotein diacylglyceryl transferase [Phycisphaerae bacterium]|nr:prolipoprotein diacylglyceryl transferase [Phycisphaerae bacterium]